jgi:hypothetical protein
MKRTVTEAAQTFAVLGAAAVAGSTFATFTSSTSASH